VSFYFQLLRCRAPRHWQSPPSGPFIAYQCLTCGEKLASKDPVSLNCTCGNLAIDPDWGRIAIRDPDRARALLRVRLW
jgi:hypothetical protein